MYFWGLHLDNFKGDFLTIFFLHPQILDFKIVVSNQILSYHNKPNKPEIVLSS